MEETDVMDLQPLHSRELLEWNQTLPGKWNIAILKASIH